MNKTDKKLEFEMHNSNSETKGSNFILQDELV